LHDTRLIAVSGYSQPKDHADAEQAGFDRLISKPITAEILEALLKEPLTGIAELRRHSSRRSHAKKNCSFEWALNGAKAHNVAQLGPVHLALFLRHEQPRAE
jgi:DNA-binding NarL/FixJ family response regulator